MSEIETKDQELFSKRYNELMFTKSLTQSEIAKATEINRQSLNKYENFKEIPKFSQLVKLADVFECSTDSFANRKSIFPDIPTQISALVSKLIIYDQEFILTMIEGIVNDRTIKNIKKGIIKTEAKSQFDPINN